MVFTSLLSGVSEAEGRRPTGQPTKTFLSTSLKGGAHRSVVGSLFGTYQALSSRLRAEKTKASHVLSATVRAPITYRWLLEQSPPSECPSFDPLCKYSLFLASSAGFSHQLVHPLSCFCQAISFWTSGRGYHPTFFFLCYLVDWSVVVRGRAWPKVWFSVGACWLALSKPRWLLVLCMWPALFLLFEFKIWSTAFLGF